MALRAAARAGLAGLLLAIPGEAPPGPPPRLRVQASVGRQELACSVLTVLDLPGGAAARMLGRAVLWIRPGSPLEGRLALVEGVLQAQDLWVQPGDLLRLTPRTTHRVAWPTCCGDPFLPGVAIGEEARSPALAELGLEEARVEEELLERLQVLAPGCLRARALAALLEAPRVEVQLRALDLVGDEDGPLLRDRIRDLLRARDVRVRMAAAAAAGRTGDLDALPFLRAGLRPSDPGLRARLRLAETRLAQRFGLRARAAEELGPWPRGGVPDPGRPRDARASEATARALERLLGLRLERELRLLEILEAGGAEALPRVRALAEGAWTLRLREAVADRDRAAEGRGPEPHAWSWLGGAGVLGLSGW
jgi:hypothetical protein